ncbi:hypothetical protein D9599_12925 [Roseomonas sp. KE2513]|uniref:acyl-CoA dehydrogenase n=1 Tax=Roseomonas sp. KE2513 TaxID=2479202 RepID=UPI0018DF1EA6|nr:acyl-CoA dehydrogenase [Roseomonas sp. KE2513]MBI0536479.1 hypothetical protein [Roseomonas sp. KE2513]
MSVGSDGLHLMADSLARMLDTGSRRERARAAADLPAASRGLGNELLEAGWLRLLLGEDSGGWGADPGEFAMLLENLGGMLAPEPLGPAIVAARLLSDCDTSATSALLSDFAEGRATLLVAQRADFPLADAPSHVLADAQWASQVLCAQWQDDHFHLLAVPITQQARGRWPMRRALDGGALWFFNPAEAGGTRIAEGPAAERAFATAQNLLRLAAAASLVGIGQRVLDLTTEYLRLRRQFGVPIGSFQALQHRAASMHVTIHGTRSLVREAAQAIGTGKETRACAMAKAKASTAVRAVLKEGVQMHGAVGFSDELELALHFRRGVVLASLFGSPAECRRDLGQR